MRYFTFLLLFLSAIISHAQPTAGTTGLLNIPSAEMQSDGTVMAGGTYLPVSLTPDTWSYNTGNYYINITFLPFLEVSYRMTLIKNSLADKFNNQDRSFAARLRVLKEKGNTPAVVIGGNDLYTTSEAGNQYFGNVYAVATKNLQLLNQNFGITLGYSPDINNTSYATGVFAGLSYSPSQNIPLQFIAEYDTNSAVNAGATCKLFKHLQLFALLYDFKDFAGGFVLTLDLIKEKNNSYALSNIP